MNDTVPTPGRPDPLDAALLAAWNAAEPELPECHLCGDTSGPWLPDPSGDRWPSGAQKLICSRRCQGEPALDAVKDSTEKGQQIVQTPGGRRLRPLSVRMDTKLSDDLAIMARAGLNASDAVRTAVSIVAGAYGHAWARGVVPEGVQPEITGCAVQPYDGPSAV